MNTMDALRVRGRTKGGGEVEWVYGHEFRDGDHVYIRPHDGSALRVVMPQSIRQSTGLHDRNHLEIYVGDILQVYQNDVICGGYCTYLVEGITEETCLLMSVNVSGYLDPWCYARIVWDITDWDETLKEWNGDWQHTQIVGSHIRGEGSAGTRTLFSTLDVKNPILPSVASLNRSKTKKKNDEKTN